MRLTAAIDAFVEDMSLQGRFNSPRTEVAYRRTLTLHAEDVGNRDPRTTNRDDVKGTLRRWRHPNTLRICRAHLVSFYRWTMEEGLRKDNPAEQTPRPKKRPAKKYRMTRDEAVRFLEAAQGARERRAVYVGMLAGLRRQELLGLRGRHFERDGWIRVSEDIGKGGKGRWVPVLPELEPVVEEIRANVDRDEFVLCAQRWRNPGRNTARIDYALMPASEQAIWRLVQNVARRAGLPAGVGPHTMRHAFGDHIARTTGNAKVAQYMLGHARLSTTEEYMGEPTLDELAGAVRGFRFIASAERLFSPLREWGAIPVEAPTGIEPVQQPSRTVERFSEALTELHRSPRLRELARSMA